MSMSKTGVVVAAVSAVIALVFVSASATSPSQAGPIYFGMDAPLTGPTQLVGQSDRQAVEAVVAYWNARGGIKGRRVVVDVLDNASNPSQAVQNVQKFISDSKYVGIFGSGNAGAAVATGAIASQAKIPFIALSPPTALVEPPQPYAYILTATARLYAYSEAAYLKKQGFKRVWLMGDNGAYGRDGPSQVSKIAKQVRPRDSGHDDLLAGVDRLLGRADADQELQRSGSLAVDGDARRGDDREAVQAAAAVPAARPHRRHVSPQFLQGTCGDVNGAIVTRSSPRRGRSSEDEPGSGTGGPPAKHPEAAGLELRRRCGRSAVGVQGRHRAGKRNPSRHQHRTRDEAPRARDTRGQDLPLPKNHQGLQLDSMWVGRIQNCQVRPLFGAAFTKKK